MDKKQLPIIIVVIVALVVVLTWWGMKNFAPEGKINTEASTKTDDLVKELKKKSGGDFSKLSPEDQEKLNKISGGRGAMMLNHM